MRFLFSEFELDADAFELRRGEQPVAIEPTPLKLLIRLLDQPCRTWTKQELLDSVWPGIAVTESSVTRAIGEARKVLRSAGAEREIIVTRRGFGYAVGVPVARADLTAQ